MTQNWHKLKLAISVLIVSSIFIFAGCSEDNGDDVVTDNTYWSLVDVNEIEVPGAIWPLGHNKAVIGADNEHVYLTDDGGHSWDIVTLNPSSERNATDMYFAGSRGIMIGLRGMLYTTTNDGQSWTDAFPAGAPSGDLEDIITPVTGGDNPLFICGDEGTLLRSLDQGVSWEYIEVLIDTFIEDYAVIDLETGETLRVVDTTLYATQEKMHFYGGWAPDEDLIYILCDTLQTDEEFYVFRSDAGGDPGSWEMLVIESAVKWYDIYTFDEENGIIISDGSIFDIAIGDFTVNISPTDDIEGDKTPGEINFVSPSLGWIIGDDGLVMKSIDGGASWDEIDVDVTGVINDLNFLDEDEGWLVGNDASRNSGAIKVTYDGGETWNFRSYGLGGVNLNGIYFISNMEGWLVGKSGRIAHSTDGGLTWLHQDANTSRSLQDIYFTDENNGWTVGFSYNGAIDTFATILETTDGGGEWIAVDSLYGYRLNKIEFLDASAGLAVGSNGIVLKSTDWETPKESGVLVELFGLDVVNATTAFASGQTGVIIKTTDGGETWSQLDSGTDQTLMSIDMVNSSVGYACGNLGTVIKTTDGGNNWALLDLPMHSSSVYKSVAFSDTETGWIAGVFGYILHTADGGETWYRQLEGFSEETLNDIFILDSSHAWIVGNGSIVLELGKS